MIQKNRRKALVLIITICASIILCCSIPDKIRYQDNWAIYNYGQVINNVKGVKGVDIGGRKLSIRDNTTVVKVAIVDTGVYDGEDAEYSENMVAGWDFYNNDQTTYDAYSFDYHGTYIANSIISVCKRIEILPVKFMSSNKGNSSDCIEAINFAIEKGVDIINCSWCFFNDSKGLRNVICSHPEVLFVVAAGNRRIDLDENESFPCSYLYDNVLTVGAMDSKGRASRISGYGKAVDVFAPGENVKGVLPENDIEYIDGTSIATAFVTGAAAYISSIYPNLKPNELKDIIIKSARKTDELKGKCNSGGYLNLENAIRTGKEYTENEES